MKKRCAGLAVLVLSLAAFGVGNAQIGFYGVINANTHNVTVDSAIVFVSPTVDTFSTMGWSATGTNLDTFPFPDLANWPDSVELLGKIDLAPNISMFPYPVADTWYRFTFAGITAPMAMFYSGAANVAEPRSAIDHLQRLSVSPSVVTGEMKVRLQPMGTGRPVVVIHDAVGNVIRSLDCTAGADGVARTTWDREDGFGRLVPEGIYFCRYAASGVVAVRKVLVTH